MIRDGWMMNGGLIEGTLVTPAQLGLAVALNVLLLLFLRRWLVPQLRVAPRWLLRLVLPIVGLRLLLSLISWFFPSKDVRGFASHGWVITRQLWDEPAGWLRTLSGNELRFEDWHVVFYGMSNTFFFHKLLSVLNLLTLSVDLLNATYLGLFCAIGCWQLVRTLLRLWPDAAPGAAVAFLLWPTMLLWTSTYTKESVLLGTGAWFLALVIDLLYGPGPLAARWSWGKGVGILLLGFLHFSMRYFFATPLFGVLLGLVVVRTAQRLGLARRRLVQALLIVAVLAVGARIAPEVSIAFRVNKFTSQMIKVYTYHVEASRHRPHFEYPHLVPTVESAVLHLPLAVVNAISRPMVGESRGIQYVAGGLENLVILTLVAMVGLAILRRRYLGPMPFALVFALALFCLILAALMGLTIPNFGALNRYRSAMLPYLLLLLLQNEYALRLLRRLGLGTPG